ncbi:MAG: hypothetical protein R3Y09_10945 [Clostridia bacterium]
MLDLIINKISQNFPESYVFNEKISQNYDDNCFVVWENKGEMKKCLKNRYLATFEYSVFYYSNGDLNSVATKLCDILTDIEEYKSTKISYEIDENTLEVTVSYTTFLLKEQEQNQNMEKFGFNLNL